MKIQTVDGLNVELDEAHWNAHVVKGHPELTAYRESAIETLQAPDGVYRSKRVPTRRIYAKALTGIRIGDTPVERISLVVIVDERNAVVVTAYFAVAAWRGFGERIWPL